MLSVTVLQLALVVFVDSNDEPFSSVRVMVVFRAAVTLQL